MSMKKIHVSVGGGYDICIGRGLLDAAGQEIKNALPDAKRLVVVTDSNVSIFYADRLTATLEAAGFDTGKFVFPAGEPSKTMDTVERMLSAFGDAGLTRGDAVVALGGGVTGDMAGFGASMWLRGIRFVQIPTTLLAQIDSSVGGKTGVNLPAGKNLAGAFHQPSLVLIDPDTLSTLPPSVFSDGMGEAIKYGCILDKTLFERLENESALEFLEELIGACIECKRSLVERDERDTGSRILLNFGHTVGHALEKCQNYAGLTHGEAVGVGMVRISRAGERAGLTAPDTADRIAALLEKYHLPVSDSTPLEAVVAAAAQDKKHSGDDLKLVLLFEIGQAMVYTLPANALGEFLTEK